MRLHAVSFHRMPLMAPSKGGLSQSCVPAATVSLYGINDALPDEALRNQMQTIASGMVVSVTRSRSVPECRLVEFWDMRAAEQALAALNGATSRVPTIVEVCCLLCHPGHDQSVKQCGSCSLWLSSRVIACLAELQPHAEHCLFADARVSLSSQDPRHVTKIRCCAGPFAAANGLAEFAVQPRDQPREAGGPDGPPLG